MRRTESVSVNEWMKILYSVLKSSTSLQTWLLQLTIHQSTKFSDKSSSTTSKSLSLALLSHLPGSHTSLLFSSICTGWRSRNGDDFDWRVKTPVCTPQQSMIDLSPLGLCIVRRLYSYFLRGAILIICPIAIAYSMGQIKKSVCVCLCVSVRVSSLSRSHFFVDFHQIGHKGVNPQK